MLDQLTSQQRKLVYMAGIVVLMIPIVWLGLPEGSNPDEMKGRLASIRTEQELGQSTFGNVDPASSSMTLVLFGFRGIAASMLWYQADELRSQKNWSELQRTAESIVLLQPHFWNVWDQQAWNLAYNVSAEFDDVRDRFFWVKQGGKFLQSGVERNRKVPELYHYMGEFVGRKIGYSDEKDLFRKYFMHDPDEAFDADGVPDNDGFPEDDWEDNGADPEINPGKRFEKLGAMDNYLVAREWYREANRVLMNEAGGEQHKMADILFRAAPYKSTMDYARARSREGLFDETTRRAWEEALDAWLNEYGKTQFATTFKGMITLNGTREELQKLIEQDQETAGATYSLEEKIAVQGREQDLTNYRYWQTLCEVERLPEMVQARRMIYDGRQAWLQFGDAVKAEQSLIPGMQQFEQILNTFQDGMLLKEDEGFEFIEDAIDAVLLYQTINAGRPLPDEYPLKSIYESTEEKIIGIRNERQERFSREMFQR
ncbi:MAG: hypothetical protein KDA75_06635 [Planctomycetaceae bacterium]|nr:hypothetical protein [Planctomycetaceae bacterium]